MLYLFDIDGTLIHCNGAGRRALERALLDLLGADALAGIRLDGKTDPRILEEAFVTRLGRPPTATEAEAVRAAYLNNLAHESRTGVTALRGVEQALMVCAARGVLGLATGNWRAGAEIKLGRVALWSRFVLGGFGCDSPDRGELVRIARRRGEARLGRPLRREEVVVIGDTPRDITAAREADAMAVAVMTGSYGAADLAGADAVFEDLRGYAATFA